MHAVRVACSDDAKRSYSTQNGCSINHATDKQTDAKQTAAEFRTAKQTGTRRTVANFKPSNRTAAKQTTVAKSLAGTIFRSVVVFTVLVVLILSTLIISVAYVVDEQHAEQQLALLATHASELLATISSSDLDSVLSVQFNNGIRTTFIDSSGTVLYDSAFDISELDNHASRPEVVSALVSRGVVCVSRYSDTLQIDTIYAAVALEDGSVIRLSEQRRSFAAFTSDMLIPVLIVLGASIAVIFFLSRMLTIRIMKPIDALDFSRPLDNDIYKEMTSLLVRIDQQQRQLMQQNEKLAAAESMRRDFSSNVSHEMKTPLQVISGYAELMKNNMIDSADQQRFAELIYNEACSMRSLINDVLILSRLDETAFGDEQTTIDMYDLALRVKNRIASFAAKQDVEVSVEGEHVCIAGNLTLAEEMLYNLVENGIRYNHEGGLVVIEVSRIATRTLTSVDRGISPQQAKLLRKAAWGTEIAEQHLVCIRVSDTGSGIPEELRDKVFERFFRLEKSRSKKTGGTGLGLAIVKHAVIYHGGTITIEDAKGGGTVFVVHLPEYDLSSTGDNDDCEEEFREREGNFSN